MSNLTSYFSDIAKVLGVSSEGIYEVVVALMAVGTADEDIEEAFKMMVGNDKRDNANSSKSYDNLVPKIALV